MSLKNCSASIVLAALPFLGSPLWADDINIYFKASPGLDLIHPYSDPATLSLLVTGADGRAVAQGRVAIRLEAPEPGWFFPTDVPLVEGTGLLNMSLPLRQGRAEWKYLFPIRGQYHLTVEFTASDARKTTKTFALRIQENRQKWFLLGIFTLALFSLGVLAGRIFTRALPRSKGRALACLLLSMSCIALPAQVAAQEVGQGKPFGWLEIDPATVGKASKVRWRLAGETNAAIQAALLTLTIAHLEKGKTVFSIERLPVGKEFAMNFQFADGAEYQVAAVAYVTGGPTLRTERNITVTGIEPPARAMIPPIGFFIVVIALGLAVGRWSRRAAPS